MSSFLVNDENVSIGCDSKLICQCSCALLFLKKDFIRFDIIAPPIEINRSGAVIG